MSLQSSLSSEIDLLDDSDEEKEAKKDLLLACMLVGEYLSEKKERPTFASEKELCVNNTSKSWLQKDLKHFKRCTEWSIVHSKSFVTS